MSHREIVKMLQARILTEPENIPPIMSRQDMDKVHDGLLALPEVDNVIIVWSASSPEHFPAEICRFDYTRKSRRVLLTIKPEERR